MSLFGNPLVPKAEPELSFMVHRVHLTSVEVDQTISRDSGELDRLLLDFSQQLLLSLIRPNRGPRFKSNCPCVHTLILGMPFEDDVSLCSPE